ncbi:PINIT domain-containing protein [Mycena crocata]|nr:PINIT domain-containing protein [Mycena crocata]
MPASQSGNDWAELEAVCAALPFGTVSDLKHIIISVNTRCGTHMVRSGLKQDLVDRLRAQFETWNQGNDVARWQTARSIVDEVKLPGLAFSRTPARIMPMASLPPPPHSVYTTASNPAHVPLPPSRSASASVLPPSAKFSTGSSTSFNPGYRFKQSPFFSIDQVVSVVLECPVSHSPTDRRECALEFQLTGEHLAKLNMPGSVFQLRLFCTSSKFYTPGYNARPGSECLIEFPPTCEVYVNDAQLKGALLKGIKRRPGTAPPPDLSLAATGNGFSINNVVRMVYINSGQGQGPLELKKYYLVVQLVQAHSVSALVDQLLNTRFVSAAEVRRQMMATMSDDDDIIAGSLKMSLKCPLTFMRISTPCRSAKCTHSQCFDATSWFAMMQQTTTWLCPVCETVLDWRELIIDGYFAEILETTPDTVDDVLVESDGQWRTTDGKYSSDDKTGAIQCRGPQYDFIDID